MPVRNAGTSTMVTCKPARSRSAAATRMTKTRGNCIAVSIRAHTQANIRTEPPPAFDEARSDFEAAWKAFLAKRTEADVRAWRSQQDWTARKYAMRQADEKLPSQKPSTLMKCVCGHNLFNGAKNQHRLQDLSDSAIKSRIGGSDNVCRPIKCNLGLA